MQPKYFKNKIVILFDSRSETSIIGNRLLRWFYNTIQKIEVDTIDTGRCIPVSLLDPDTNNSNYLVIFNLSVADGQDLLTNEWWESLNLVNQIIPIVAFHKSSKIFTDNPIAKKIFGCYYYGQASAQLNSISLDDSLMSKDVVVPGIEAGLDEFTYVRACEGKSIARISNDDFMMQNGINLYCGQKGLIFGLLNGFFEWGKPQYYMQVWNNILRLSPQGFARARMVDWQVALRMDDLPSNWFLERTKAKVMNENQIEDLLFIFQKYGVKLTVMFTAFYIEHSKHKSWTETQRKGTIASLIKGLDEELVEIGLHGYDHAIPDDKLINKVIKILPFVYKIPWFRNKFLVCLREYYDCWHNHDIDYDIQKNRMTLSMKELQHLFGVEPKVFTPPTHTWSSTTEKVLEDLGIPYMSCDYNFYVLPFGKNRPKFPCFLGESSYNSEKVMSLPVTLFGPLNSLVKSAPAFFEFGIPLIWLKHCYYPDWLDVSTAEKAFECLQSFENVKYLSISQIGEILGSYRGTSISLLMGKDEMIGYISTAQPLILKIKLNERLIEEVRLNSEVWNDFHQDDVYIPTGNWEVTITYKDVIDVPK